MTSSPRAHFEVTATEVYLVVVDAAGTLTRTNVTGAPLGHIVRTVNQALSSEHWHAAPLSSWAFFATPQGVTARCINDPDNTNGNFVLAWPTPSPDLDLVMAALPPE